MSVVGSDFEQLKRFNIDELRAIPATTKAEAEDDSKDPIEVTKEL
jgi:hypothetical protein